VIRRRPSAIARLCLQTNRCLGPWRWIVVLTALFPAAAWAQLHAMPYGDVSYQYNSNIFALPASAAAPIGNHGPTFADRILEERGGIEALYGWSQQEFYGNFEARHFDYDQFGDLSHNEYLAHGGLKWKLVGLFDGVVDYRRERSMVNFANFAIAPAGEVTGTTTQLFVQVQSVTTASANLQFTPDWRLESQGVINDLDSPRPGFPDLSLTERSIHEGLRYVGVAKLSTGIDVIFLDGHFNGPEFVLSPKYSQTTVEAAAKYVATGLSSFNGAIGYTRRKQDPSASIAGQSASIAGTAETISGTTGLLNYQRNLTGKTSVNLGVSRAVNSYVTYGGTEIDSSVNLGAVWNATGKLAVTPAYQWTYSTFPGADLTGEAPVGTERVDHYQLATLSVKYQIRDWLSLRPYGQYETRRSDVGPFSFNRSMYGIEVEVRLSTQADQPYELNLPTYQPQ
jgi:hypothetical protein